MSVPSDAELILGKCPLCKARIEQWIRPPADSHELRHWEVRRCSGCGLGLTFPVPEGGEAAYDNDYRQDRHSFTARYCVRRRIKWLEQIRRPGTSKRVLDLGCGDGEFLRAALAKGWDGVGTELEHLPKHSGLEVVVGTPEPARVGTFGVVTMWHSLEHFRDPVMMVAAIDALLEPNGRLVIAVPNAGSLQTAVFGGAWFHLDPATHVSHFTMQALASLFRAQHLKLVRRWAVEGEYELFGWIQSALNLIVPQRNVLFDVLVKRPWRFPQGWGLVSVAVGGVLLPLAMLASVMAIVLSRPATLAIALERE